MITNTQAEVIYMLHREMGYKVGEGFPLVEAFPEDDRYAEELRRTVCKLGEMGLLAMPYGSQVQVFQVTQKALQAYDQWAYGGRKVKLTWAGSLAG